MPGILFRSAVLEDAPVLAHIQTQAWKAAFCDIISPEDMAQATDVLQTQAMYQYVLAHHLAHVLLLCVDGVSVGTCSWSANRDDLGKDTAELICIHCLPQFWGQGYGGHMMKHVFTQVRQEGYSRLVLWVFQANQRARGFYEKLGFTATQLRKTTLGAEELLYTISL